MPRIVLPVAVTALALAFAGCGGGSEEAKTSAAAAPKPDLARILPRDYRVEKIAKGNLLGQAEPEVIVVSKGPAVGEFGFHPVQLQVLSWDEVAERWNVVFDAQKVKQFQQQFGTTASNQYVSPPPDLPAGSAPILDRTADGEIDQVAFVRFGDGDRSNLVFSTIQSYGGSGSPGSLVVVGAENDEPAVRYLWYGDGGVGFRVAGLGRNQTVAATARFWTPVDAHCCPVRDYDFTIGEENETITSIEDDRPWLGLFVEAVRESESDSPLRVVGLVPGSPAAEAFREGDVITELTGATSSEEQGALGPAIIDQLALTKAGEQAAFRIRRGSSEIVLTVELGSLIDSSAQSASPPEDMSVMTI